MLSRAHYWCSISSTELSSSFQSFASSEDRAASNTIALFCHKFITRASRRRPRQQDACLKWTSLQEGSQRLWAASRSAAACHAVWIFHHLRPVSFLLTRFPCSARTSGCSSLLWMWCSLLGFTDVGASVGAGWSCGGEDSDRSLEPSVSAGHPSLWRGREPPHLQLHCVQVFGGAAEGPLGEHLHRIEQWVSPSPQGTPHLQRGLAERTGTIIHQLETAVKRKHAFVERPATDSPTSSKNPNSTPKTCWISGPMSCSSRRLWRRLQLGGGKKTLSGCETLKQEGQGYNRT